MDTSEARKARARGEKAANLLDNETLKAAFDETLKQINDEFHKADTSDTAQLQALCAEVKAVKRVRERLQTFVNAGKEAQRKLSNG